MGKKYRTLSGPVEQVIDSRPTHTTVDTFVGLLRIRRMPPHQLIAQLQHFTRYGLTPADLSCWTVPESKAEICRFLQRCLVPLANNHLAFPGQQGYVSLFLWPDAELERLAIEAARFMQIDGRPRLQVVPAET